MRWLDRKLFDREEYGVVRRDRQGDSARKERVWPHLILVLALFGVAVGLPRGAYQDGAPLQLQLAVTEAWKEIVASSAPTSPPALRERVVWREIPSLQRTRLHPARQNRAVPVDWREKQSTDTPPESRSQQPELALNEAAAETPTERPTDRANTDVSLDRPVPTTLRESEPASVTLPLASPQSVSKIESSSTQTVSVQPPPLANDDNVEIEAVIEINRNEAPDRQRVGEVDRPRDTSIATPHGGVAPKPKRWGNLNLLNAEFDRWAARGEPWAQTAHERLTEIGTLTPNNSAARALLAEWSRSLPTEPELLATAVDTPDGAAAQARLRRHVMLWHLMAQSGIDMATANDASSPVDTAQLVGALAKVTSYLSTQESGASWVAYLELTALGDALAQHQLATPAAQRTLRRFGRRRLSKQQRMWLARSPFRELQEALARIVRQQIALPPIAEAAFRYEREPTHRHRAQLARHLECLRLSSLPEHDRWSTTLDQLYRGANLRISVSERLVNRVLPAVQPRRDNVRDHVLGADVRGASQTWTQLHVDVKPQRDGLRMELNASGEVHSTTESRKGPVILGNQAAADYTASKEIIVTDQGVQMRDAQVVARGQTWLQSISSEFDAVPVVGWLVRQFARDQHAEHHGLLRRRLESRVSTQARQQMNQQLEARAERLKTRLNEAVLAPLKELDIEPDIEELVTSEDRMAMQYRLADSDQLTAHTPRPLALRDSVMSVQIHDSLINNLLGQLRLDNWDGPLTDLIAEMKQELQWEQVPSDAANRETPDDVELTLGGEQPVRIICHDGRVEIQLHIARLAVGDREWRNFLVRGYYRPADDPRSADLVRDGSIRMRGRRFGLGDQIAVRAIFTKVFAPHARWQVVAQSWLDRVGAENVGVTQFVIEDGWIGVSVGEPSDLPPVWIADRAKK